MELKDTDYIEQLEMEEARKRVEERRKAKRKRKRREIIIKTAVTAVSSAFLGFAIGVNFCDWKQNDALAIQNIPEAAAAVAEEVVVEIPVKFCPLTDLELDTLVESCMANNIPVNVALGLIFMESSFKSDALNLQTGCYGYCQLNPKYFPAGLSPVENIQTGINYLGECLTRYDGDLDAALTAYNAGHDTGSRWYANAVMEAAKAWD